MLIGQGLKLELLNYLINMMFLRVDLPIWKINLSDDILEIVPKEFLREGVRIKIIGEEFECEDYCFNALMLRPFDGGRKMIDNIESFDREIFNEMNLHMRGMMDGRINKALRD